MAARPPDLMLSSTSAAFIVFAHSDTASHTAAAAIESRLKRKMV